MPSIPDMFTSVKGMLVPVPDELRLELAPATWIIHEWTDYQVSYLNATHIRIGSRLVAPSFSSNDGMSHFPLRFENELGLAIIEPVREGRPSGVRLYLEVIAKKFSEVDHSLAFMRDMLADIFARGNALPFDISTKTRRGVRDAARAPSDLFAYHFFRHHRDELVRAIQAILGSPHRVLSDRTELVRIHEVKRIDTESILHMLQASSSKSGLHTVDSRASALQRLQPERVLQRVPEETIDTPENRFILSAARRMESAINRIRKASWYQKVSSPVQPHDRVSIDVVHQHLRQLVTDRRFIDLDPVMSIPAQSRVLQRKDGYREMSLLWNAFHRFQEPVYQQMEQAIDLRDVATLYEFWLLFELIDGLHRVTGIRPRLRGFDEIEHPGNAFTATFKGCGKLTYQASFSGKDVYSGITLRPDFVWETSAKRRIVMDAKFRIQYPWPTDGEDSKNLSKSRATTDDITKMHAYRDAIDGVTAALVLYPGVNGFFRTSERVRVDVNHIDQLLDAVVCGDLCGIGAIPMSPVRPKNTMGEMTHE